MNERRVIVDYAAETDDRLAYVLEHIDREFDDLRKDLKELIEAALITHTEKLAHKDDLLFPPVAKRAADTAADHWWTKVSRKGMVFFAGAVLTAFLVWLGSIGIVFKGPPK